MKVYKIIYLIPCVVLLLWSTSCNHTDPDTPVDPNKPDKPDLTELPAGLSSSPALPSTEKPCTLYYKASGNFPFSGFTDDLYVHIWIRNISGDVFVQSEWAVNTDKCKLAKTETENVWKLEIEPSVRAWFGADADDQMSKIGVVVRNADGSKQSADMFIELDDAADEFVPAQYEEKEAPAGIELGINYLSSTSVCLAFYDKDKNGEHYDHCFIVGDFNDWSISNDYQMKRDESKGLWWYTLEGLTEGKEYRFQYHLIKEGGEEFRTFDPYTEVTYDGSDDKWISSSTYPDMPAFPEKTGGILGAFQTNAPEYKWKYDNFKIEDKDNLVIYELLFRDFSTTHDIKGAMQHLDYLEELGINAIELMPCQEFDGNDSWGYNPRAYFALDKAYGTREMYKEFIDECHRRGIAVLMDVVYNHTTGSHPMARLYWDSANNRTAENNPWYNVTATHPFSVYHDLNHENTMVRDHIKRSLVYLLDEYHIDGFRFDLTKGFTQRQCNESNVANYDPSRIAILKDYADAIFNNNPDAVMICEHFCETREEKELGAYGMKLWRNMNNAYCQTAMGWLSDGDDLSGVWTGSSMPFGSLVSYMESHDEERTAYKALTWGNGECKTNLEVRSKRLGLNAAFTFLVPGPKMIWQFGELGYDISIEEGGRTSAKPILWNYFEDPSRKQLYNTYAQLLDFRFSNPSLFTSSATFTIEAGSGRTSRALYCTNGDKGFVLVGNFDTKNIDLTAWPPMGGVWRDVFTSETYDMPQNAERKIVFSNCAQGEFHLLVKE